MIETGKQPIRIKLQLSYDASVYEGDPQDAFDIADLEKGEMEEELTNYLTNLLGDLKDFKLIVQPE